MRSSHAVRVLVVTLLLSWLAVGAQPASSVSQDEVDRACAAEKGALADLEAAKGRFDDAAAHYAEVTGELEAVTFRELRIRETVEEHERTVGDIRERLVDTAIELYMNGGGRLTEVLLSASTVDEVITGQEFLEAVTESEVASLDDLTVLKRDLERLHDELEQTQADLQQLQAEAEASRIALEAAMEESAAIYRTLREECATLYEQRQAELAAAEARRQAQLRGAAGGLASAATPGFICPMDPGAVSFINDWGFPRSGGRTHKGTDVFASYGQPMYAVADGSIRFRSGRLGGTSIWLSADYGASFYYAHLSGYASGLSSGQRVAKGQVIGYNGDSGNARGGAPHLHFQIHPGGGSPVNPYFTLKRACG